MNTTRFAAWGIGLALLFSASTVLGQERTRPQPPRQPGQDRPDFGRFLGRVPPLMTPDVMEKLTLNDEQKNKIEKLVKEHADKQKANTEKVVKELEQAREKRDEQALREAFAKMREVRETVQKTEEEYQAKVVAVLNDEQKKKFEELRRNQRFPRPGFEGRPSPNAGGSTIGQILPTVVQDRLRLTEEQKKELEKVQKDVDEKLKKLLNEEQQRQLERLKQSRGGFGGFGGFNPGDRPDRPESPRRPGRPDQPRPRPEPEKK